MVEGAVSGKEAGPSGREQKGKKKENKEHGPTERIRQRMKETRKKYSD